MIRSVKKQPNIVYIYADDLDRGMLSCYGQEHYQTANIDRLANEGMRFTQAYGVPFCAPARANLLNGMHDAYAGRWTFKRLHTIMKFEALLVRGAVQYVRPDVCLAGGLTHSKKIAAIEEAHQMGVVPHNPFSPVSTAACRMHP